MFLLFDSVFLDETEWFTGFYYMKRRFNLNYAVRHIALRVHPPGACTPLSHQSDTNQATELTAWKMTFTFLR